MCSKKPAFLKPKDRLIIHLPGEQNFMICLIQHCQLASCQQAKIFSGMPWWRHDAAKYRIWPKNRHAAEDPGARRPGAGFRDPS